MYLSLALFKRAVNSRGIASAYGVVFASVSHENVYSKQKIINNRKRKHDNSIRALWSLNIEQYYKYTHYVAVYR
jgi:hypothetical protein